MENGASGANVPAAVNAAVSEVNASTELSMRRTGLSFQRTRMSADRTLMSVQRTALSLIGFGFTIFNFFRTLKNIEGAKITVGENAPRNFGMTLVIMGIGLLALGIWQNVSFLRHLRAERDTLKGQGLLHGESPWPLSVAQVAAILVLLLGLYAIFGMMG